MDVAVSYFKLLKGQSQKPQSQATMRDGGSDRQQTERNDSYTMLNNIYEFQIA